jgi:hypothetical protein
MFPELRAGVHPYKDAERRDALCGTRPLDEGGVPARISARLLDLVGLISGPNCGTRGTI